MADLKPVYLVSGEDGAKIDAWRARVRRRAEDENGPGGLETLDARENGPAEVAAALSALTFGTGTRYVLVDGVEVWKAGDLDPLERELAAPPPDTVLVLIARGKGPTERLVNAVEKAGGERREYAAPKPWQLPTWTAERAQEEGLRLDKDAAKRLVELAGPSQQRIAREVEKLAILAHPQRELTAEQVERLASGESSAQGYDVADAVVAGDLETAIRLAERLTTAGEAPARLVYPVMRRLRDVRRAAELLDAGLSERDAAAALGSAPWVAKRAVAQAKGADRSALARALCVLADLEVSLRSGELADEHTGVTLALARASG
jgi:DNA polymerase-3 subunit delta